MKKTIGTFLQKLANLFLKNETKEKSKTLPENEFNKIKFILFAILLSPYSSWLKDINKIKKDIAKSLFLLTGDETFKEKDGTSFNDNEIKENRASYKDEDAFLQEYIIKNLNHFRPEVKTELFNWLKKNADESKSCFEELKKTNDILLEDEKELISEEYMGFIEGKCKDTVFVNLKENRFSEILSLKEYRGFKSATDEEKAEIISKIEHLDRIAIEKFGDKNLIIKSLDIEILEILVSYSSDNYSNSINFSNILIIYKNKIELNIDFFDNKNLILLDKITTIIKNNN